MSGRSVGRARTSRRRVARSSGSRTIRIEVVQAPANPVARPDMFPEAFQTARFNKGSKF